jgi:hypothetical protein
MLWRWRPQGNVGACVRRDGKGGHQLPDHAVHDPPRHVGRPVESISLEHSGRDL